MKYFDLRDADGTPICERVFNFDPNTGVVYYHYRDEYGIIVDDEHGNLVTRVKTYKAPLTRINTKGSPRIFIELVAWTLFVLGSYTAVLFYLGYF